MLSKSDSKFIKSLQLKKYRKVNQVFVVEGGKNLLELVASSFTINRLLLTRDFYEKERYKFEQWYKIIEIVTEKELINCGTYQSNNAGLAVVSYQESNDSSEGPLTLVLDDIRDPGNLGTIIRTADWYGLKKIICSDQCADCYNPKVINASMGSIFRVTCHYADLHRFLKDSRWPKYGADLTGKDIHHFEFSLKSIIVIGNESKGLGKELKPLMTESLNIPRYGQAESLNAAIATAIFCDNFFRKVKG